MYFLNLSNLSLSNVNWSFIKKIISILSCIFLFSCSSNNQFSNNYFSDDGYARGFVHENYSHNQFSAANKDTIKKPLSSDHQLMMSLLNRPVTTDQAMMIAFAQERVHFANLYSNTGFANYGVQIKGDKSSDQPNSRLEPMYMELISQDINAVSISAPQ